MKTRFSILAAAACIVLVGAPALADWKIKVTEHPDGGYVSSIVLPTNGDKLGVKGQGEERMVGRYATRQEARAAAEAKGKEWEDRNGHGTH